MTVLSSNEKYGLARSISLMPGDVISAEVYAKYVDPNSTNWNGALTTLMSNIASSAAGVVVDGVNYTSSTSSFPVSYPGLVTKTDTGAPKAYLNWLVFDRDFVFITGGFQQISTASREIGNDVAHERLASPNISISQPGYVYIYVSNENATPIDCYFDDLKVTQIKSPIVQTNTYYPFGLDIPSLSYGREGNKKNNYLYNGRSELQDDLGLNNYFTPLRIQETDAPRWWQVDPKVDDFYGWSPYNYAFNNPVINNDPNGDCPICVVLVIAAMVLDASFAEAPRSQVTPQTQKQDQETREFLRDANGVVTTVVNPGNSAKQFFGKSVGKVMRSQMNNTPKETPVMETSRSARREVMRQEGIPTSQQPKSQSKNKSGREYTYEAPKEGGGKQQKSVQQQTMDESHKDQPHWEAGKVKTDESGNTRMTNHGRPKLQNDKSKVEYKENE